MTSRKAVFAAVTAPFLPETFGRYEKAEPAVTHRKQTTRKFLPETFERLAHHATQEVFLNSPMFYNACHEHSARNQSF